jgi:hypothetical protein
MQPFTACILGMMVGSVVLLGTIIFKPHQLNEFAASDKNVCFCKK